MESEVEIAPQARHFLNGGGELGELTRQFDWAQTSLGAPAAWPQSLRTTVAMILSSKFPMFLWWGDDMIQFYNDAYRPSLGADGKHPLALGQKAEECWPEIWNIIYPLIDQVRTTGEATWSEDQLIPIYRNGKIEDVYWTFGYSPISGETEKVEGVLVVCNETTEKVNNLRSLQESEERFRTMAEAFKQSERRFRNLIDESTIATAVLTGPDLVIDLANPAILELWGRDESCVGKSLLETFPELASQPYLSILRQVLETGKMYSDNAALVRIERKGKLDYLYRDFSYKPLFNDMGEVSSILVMVVDVTERIQVQERLVQSEQRVRSLVESAPYPIGVYTGREMRIELANQAIIDAWGQTENVIGKRFADVLSVPDNEIVFEQLDQVFITGVPFHTRNQLVNITVDGKMQPYYFNYSFTPLYDAAGNVYGIMNTGADVTDLNIAKQKVEESERSIRNTILKAPVAMCIFRGPQYTVEIANDRMIELWGRSAADVMGKPIFEGLPEAKDQGFEQMLDTVFKTGDACSAQDIPITLPRNGDIEKVYVNFVYEAFREANGVISGIIAVATDVTTQWLARKEIEEVVAVRTKELAEANANLQRSNAELAQFAYIASHDLQEPVRKVGTFAQMLEQSLGNIDERSQKYLEKISTSTTRMTTLIRDVLAYSQLSKEKEIFAPVDLRQVIDAALNDFELLIEQKQAVIHCGALPVIQGIPLQISQLFGNLLSNALKFSRNDVRPVINISASLLTGGDLEKYPGLEPGPAYYDIVFTDNGIGFNQEYAAQIFNIFQRLHGKTEYAGTGIGLAMCKRIAQNHHGEIFATGSVGEGAAFHVILPVKNN